MKILNSILAVCVLLILMDLPVISKESNNNSELDKKVKAFLYEHEYGWRDMNVPEADGKKLYDLIIKGNYKSALEIGTSTGHSSIWIAWALSKTGGKLITIEIDETRYREALENFKKAGLSEYIDARLADAHDLVKELEGPFDFVFCDADKQWYVNYFKALDLRIIKGGCFTAHNVSESVWGRGGMGTGEFRKFIRTLKNYNTVFFSEGAGMSISCKAK